MLIVCLPLLHAIAGPGDGQGGKLGPADPGCATKVVAARGKRAGGINDKVRNVAFRVCPSPVGMPPEA